MIATVDCHPCEKPSCSEKLLQKGIQEYPATVITYRKIPKISTSKYKPPKLVTQKNPPLNRHSKYKPPGGLYLENCPRIQSKKTVNFLPTIRLAQSVLKRKFPSVYKPLQKKAPQKGPLKNISPGAYFGFYGSL